MRVIGFKEMEDDKKYGFGKKPTNLFIKLSETDKSKGLSFKMLLVSNQDITNEEFEFWKAHLSLPYT